MYTAWSVVNWVKGSMSISVSQTLLQYVHLFCFVLQEYKKTYDPSPEKKSIDCVGGGGALLKVLFAISGVCSWFSHVAGNI